MKTGPSTPSLALLALGVVYGDIGTSPLYAVKETFDPAHGIPLTGANILGGLSTVFWVLMVVVSLKYVTLVLRADNRGEGGIMALLALAISSTRGQPGWTAPLLAIGVSGASLFYGDAVLTPAISVLSAIEGLEVGTAALKPYIVPIATGILIGLFLIQKHGTGFVGLLFGPVCALWFLSIGAVGAWNIARQPSILEALDPAHALGFVTGHGFASFAVLGSVLLAITGAEALYADVGHFGKRAVRLAWFGLVAPALVLNYFGQGALLMADPRALENPFYLSCPSWALYPMIALATAATVIASQATISGAYSMTRQAIQLGYLPRMDIEHTSAKSIGQIYIVAVMGTMLATTFLTFFVIRHGWGLPLWLCLAATGFFMLVDLTLFGAALLKVHDGGWFPLALGAAIFLVMATWRRGRAILAERLRDDSVPLEPFLKSVMRDPPQRVSGTAVFLSAAADTTPHALLHSLKHFQALHERVVFLTVEFRDVPWVAFEERVVCQRLGARCWRVRARYGFMNRPDVAKALEQCAALGLDIEPMQTSYFVSRQRVVPGTGPGGMALWRERICLNRVPHIASAGHFLGRG